MMSKVVAIIQARMGSTRLPGKVLADIGGKPMLAHLVDRIQSSLYLDEIVIATTQDASDEPVLDFCTSHQLPCFRGDQFDVLDRYYRTSLSHQAGIVVRLTADCPLLDGELMDQVVHAHREQQVDFTTNRLPPPWKRSFPIGLDIEVANFSALEKAWIQANQPYEREHVMPYLYNQPGRFKTLVLQNEPDLGNERWTVDTPSDLEMIRIVFHHFRNQPGFRWNDVKLFLEEHPEVVTINQNVQHKVVSDVDQRFKRMGD